MQTTHLSQPPSGVQAPGARHGSASNNIVPKSGHLPAVSQGVVAQTLTKAVAHATAMAAVVPSRVEQEEIAPKAAPEQPQQSPRRAATAADVLLNWARFS
jgi:hypothetical protein